MKSRQDFLLLGEYVDYLTDYYSGLILAQILSTQAPDGFSDSDRLVKHARAWAYSLAVINTQIYRTEGE